MKGDGSGLQGSNTTRDGISVTKIICNSCQQRVGRASCLMAVQQAGRLWQKKTIGMFVDGSNNRRVRC